MKVVLEALEEIVPYHLSVVFSAEDDDTLLARCARGPGYSSSLRDFRISFANHSELREILTSDEIAQCSPTEPHWSQLDLFSSLPEVNPSPRRLYVPLHFYENLQGLLVLDQNTEIPFADEQIRITKSLARIISLSLVQSMAADHLLVEREALTMERNQLLDELHRVGENLVGNSPCWLKVIDKIRLVAPTDSPVLILGETGTGKERVAQAIYQLSSRSQRPLIALNCSTLTKNLVESELFGHEKGAFTGATSSRRGRFELAHNGTLFLDEMGELPLELQPKLLRALQEQTFERVGGEKTMQADVRIICATKVDLEQTVEKGDFREDLYYRLNVFPIHLPPLRRRRDDVILLAQHFLEKLSQKMDRSPFELSRGAVSFLKSHSWPGNVRELENVLERGVILCRGKILQRKHLQILERDESPPPDPPATSREKTDQVEPLETAIRRHIQRALDESGGKIYGDDGAATILDLVPTTLQSKMKKLGIKANKKKRQRKKKGRKKKSD